MLTLNEVQSRVRLALELEQIDEPELFEAATSRLFTDLIRALAFARCEHPQAACRAASLLLCLEADPDDPA